MNKLLICFSLLWAYTIACEPCICNKWAGTLSCYGPEVDTFPNITGEGISHIDIIKTLLTQLPDLTMFTDLFTMDITDNRLIDCQDVLELKENANNVLITTDCNNIVDDFCHVSKECIQYCVDILSNHII